MSSNKLLLFGPILAIVCILPPSRLAPEMSVADELTHEDDADRFKPNWTIGDRWVVETQTKRPQAADTDQASRTGPPVRWQFSVQAREKVGGRECFRVEVQSVQERAFPQAKISLWVDRNAWALVQCQTQLWVAGVQRTITESYQFPGQQPTPVMGPLTALPVDFPLLLGGRMKGTQAFSYEAVPGPSGTKDIGDLGFAFDVTQDLDARPSEHARKLLHADFVKSLEARPMLEVKLKTFHREVKQLWQAGLPWPAYSDNGVTVARLVKQIPARNVNSQDR